MIGAYLDQLEELGERAGRAGRSRGDDERASASGCTTRSGTGEIPVAGRVEGRELLHRPAGGDASPSRCRARSAPGRRRRSGSAGCCGPKADGRQAHFYTVVARDTLDQEYAAHRQRFLAEQGYAYRIVDADDVLADTDTRSPLGSAGRSVRQIASTDTSIACAASEPRSPSSPVSTVPPGSARATTTASTADPLRAHVRS